MGGISEKADTILYWQESPCTCMNLENLHSGLLVGQRDLNFPKTTYYIFTVRPLSKINTDICGQFFLSCQIQNSDSAPSERRVGTGMCQREVFDNKNKWEIRSQVEHNTIFS
jgi:hypothetical protein